jgi:hypothetical protein
VVRLHHFSIFTKFLWYSQHLSTITSTRLLVSTIGPQKMRTYGNVSCTDSIQLQHIKMYILISTSLRSQSPNRMLKRRLPHLGLKKPNFVLIDSINFITRWQHMVLNASESYTNNVEQFRIGDTIPKRKKKHRYPINR